MVDFSMSAKSSRNTNPSTNHRKNREYHQRPQHDPRTVMYAMRVSMSVIIMRRFLRATLAKECQVPQPEHIERREAGRKQPNKPDNLADRIWRHERLIENLVLTEEPRERWNPADSKDCHRHRPEGDRNLPPQPTHHAHVLLAAQRVNH